MSTLTIQSLLAMIRSFSNEITTAGLAHKLGISYSTLARCKSGIWPPSITFDAMKGVFDGCLSEYFRDDSDAFVQSALGFLDRENIPIESFQKRYEDGGYDAFITELIATAHAETKHEDTEEELAIDPVYPNGKVSWQNALALLVTGTLVVKLVDALVIVSLAHRFQIPYLKKSRQRQS